MNRISLFVLALVLPVVALTQVYAQTGNSPPCTAVKQVNIAPDSAKQHILRRFIANCEKEYWRYDKGIVLLHEYRNSAGKQCWLLLPSMDDSYKDNPPARFADFEGDIVLIFDAVNGGTLKPAAGDTAARNQCVEQILGDRVYRRPTVKGRWTNLVLPLSNKPLKEGRHRTYGGNGGSLIIIFNADGSYKAMLPV